MLFRRFFVLTCGVLVTIGTAAHGQEKPASAGDSPAVASPEALQEAVAAEPTQNADSHAAEEAKPTAVDPLATPQSQTPADAPKPDRIPTTPEAAPQPPAGEAPGVASQEKPADGAATGLAATPTSPVLANHQPSESKQADPPAAAEPATSLPANTARVTVQLIRVCSDWSKGKDPEETKKALESLLEGASLPDEFRKDLLGSASRVLFPEDFAAIYQPEQFTDLLAWMTQRDLVHIDARSEPLPDDSESRADPKCRLFVSHDVVPLPINPSSERVPPFVTRTYGWEWKCTSWLEPDEPGGQPNLQISLFRAGLRLDEFQVDGEKSVTREPLSGDVKSVALPADRIAVIRHFDSRDAMSQRTREAGWEPFLVVRPVALAEPQASDQPQPRKPSALVKLSNRSRRRETAPQLEPNLAPAAEADQHGSQVIAFHLKHARATELAPLLEALIPSGALTADHEANSLVAHGAENELNNLKVLLEKLDVPPASTATPPGFNPGQIKVFHLVNAEARQVTEILAQLLERAIPQCVLVPDPRTNSLIARGPDDQMQIIEAILLKLDETPDNPPTPPSGEVSRRENLDATRNEFASKESEARTVAQSIVAEQNTAAAKELRTRLQRLVSESFDLRQRLQRAEAGLLRERIAIVETRLQQREILRKEIIEQRVEELLAGDENWTSPEGTTIPPRSPSESAKETPSATRPTDVPPLQTASSWVSDNVVRFLNPEDREAQWTAAYQEQRAQNPWTSLSPEFRECIKAMDQNQTIPANFLNEYKGIIRQLFPHIDAIIDRRRPRRLEDSGKDLPTANAMPTREPEFEGIVEWNEADYARIQQGVYWVYRPWTVEVRLAQEDLWCYEAILRSIAKTNHDAGATSYFDAPVKRIETLQIGQPAGAAMESIRPRRAHLAYFGDGHRIPDGSAVEAVPNAFLPAVSPAENSTPSSRTEEAVAKRLRTGRYVDLTGAPLPADVLPYPEFNLLPVRLTIDIEPARLPDLLARLATCAMPVDVWYVQYGVDQGARNESGFLPGRLLVRATILGVIRIFNPPDKAKLSGVPEGSALPEPVPSAFEQSTGMHFGPRPSLPLRSPEEFHRAARDARAAIADTKGRFDGLHGVQKQMSETQYKQELAQLEDYLASANQQLALIQAEFAAQLQLLALDVRTSEAQLAAASEAFQRLTKLYQQKAVSESELSEARLKQEQALSQLEQAKTLLDLYQQAGQNPDLSPGSAKPPKDATDSQPTSTESASPVPPVTGGASPGSTSRLPLRSPEEFQRLAAEARAKAEKLDNDLSWAPGRKDAMDPALYERYVSDLTAELASARHRLSLIQAEFAAQIEMLTTELASADMIVQSTREAVDLATGAFQTGMTPRAEVNKAEREHDQAKSQRDRAATLLKLYKNLQTNPDLVPPTKEEPKAGKPAPVLPAPGNAADPGTPPAGPQPADSAPAATP